jgi:hypothetical protein
MQNIRRLNKSLIPKGDVKGVTIFQNIADEKLYYKNRSGVLVEIGNDGLETRVTTNEADIATNTAAIAALPAAPTYAEATMSAAQILAADSGGSGAFELLADPGDGSYYIFDEIIAEYTHVSTNYSGGGGGSLEIQQNGYTIGILDKGMFETIGANNYIVLTSGSPNYTTTAENLYPFQAGALTVLHQDLNGWSGGDGTLLFKFRYKLVTPGTEL